MFRLIWNIEDVDYNTLIDMVSEMIKQNKDNPALKGMKIPPMGFSMLKNLPTDKKNEMFAMVINQDKARSIQTLQSVITSKFGAVRILDVVGSAVANGVGMQIDVGAFDFDRGIDLFFPKYLKKEDFKEALGDEDAFSMTIDEFCQSVKALPLNDKEVVFLRAIRMKKEQFLSDIEYMIKSKGISAHLSELKILVRG